MVKIARRINRSIGVLSTDVLSTVPFLHLTKARSLPGIGRLHMISTRPMEAEGDTVKETWQAVEQLATSKDKSAEWFLHDPLPT